MPQTPTLVMTRPIRQARQFVADCTVLLGSEPKVIYAPVMKIEQREAAIDPGRYAGIIVTSANGARMAPDYAGKRVYCVGQRAAQVATDRGGDMRLVAGNADALVAALLDDPPPTPLVHFRGEHVRGKIAERLTSAEIETDFGIVYSQTAQPLCPEAIECIQGEAPALLPLFSPRSARLTGQMVDHPGGGLHAIAISEAVAEAWREQTDGETETCETPTGEEMLSRCVAALRRQGA